MSTQNRDKDEPRRKRRKIKKQKRKSKRSPYIPGFKKKGGKDSFVNTYFALLSSSKKVNNINNIPKDHDILHLIAEYVVLPNCDKCSELDLGSQVFECDGCHDVYCQMDDSDSAKTSCCQTDFCDICIDQFCDNCSLSNCSDCDGKICDRCRFKRAKSCDYCENKTYCPKCADELCGARTCDSCGKFCCEDCVDYGEFNEFSDTCDHCDDYGGYGDYDDFW